MAATRRSAGLALDTYDPFGASSSSFLPPMGLFSPVAPSPASSRPTPGFCATIFEEEDQEDALSSTSTTSTITPDQRRPSAFSIHPRILRSDSCSDDDSDIPPVLRFPVPPTTIPSSTPFPNRSPPKHLPTLKPVSIPPPPPELKSCFDDDDDDEDFVAPSPVSSRRTSPTSLTGLVASRPAPPPPSKSMTLLKKATSALKSTSPPRSSAKPTAAAATEKPLPKAPQPQRPCITPTPYEEQPISVSPTPSLSSSSSSSDCSSSTMPYIPVGSIIPAPAIVQDLDEYLETLEMYFPSELWEEQPHELRRKPNSAAVKSRLPAQHRKRPSAESSSSSSCSRSSSYENLQHRRKSSFDDAVVDVQKLLKNSASSGNMKLASYTSTSSTSVRVSSPLSPPAEIRSHSRSGSDSPTSTAYSSSPSNSSTNSTVTPGSRTPSPTFAKHATPLSPPKSILKPSKSSPLLRDRSTSVSSTTSSVAPAPVSRSSSRSSSNYNFPMSPTRGRAPVPMQLFAR